MLSLNLFFYIFYFYSLYDKPLTILLNVLSMFCGDINAFYLFVITIDLPIYYTSVFDGCLHRRIDNKLFEIQNYDFDVLTGQCDIPINR